MSVALALLLIANAVFNVVVWPTFYRRVARDPRARTAAGKPAPFLIVHVLLVCIALVLAAASAVLGLVTLASGV